jgi:hypothetical protein
MVRRGIDRRMDDGSLASRLEFGLRSGRGCRRRTGFGSLYRLGSGRGRYQGLHLGFGLPFERAFIFDLFNYRIDSGLRRSGGACGADSLFIEGRAAIGAEFSHL